MNARQLAALTNPLTDTGDWRTLNIHTQDTLQPDGNLLRTILAVDR